jgi:hypothetical protein
MNAPVIIIIRIPDKPSTKPQPIAPITLLKPYQQGINTAI